MTKNKRNLFAMAKITFPQRMGTVIEEMETGALLIESRDNIDRYYLRNLFIAHPNLQKYELIKSVEDNWSFHILNSKNVSITHVPVDVKLEILEDTNDSEFESLPNSLKSLIY